MKNKILTAIAVMASLCGYAQTKGTSAVGFGINSQTSKYHYKDASGADKTDENKINSYSLGYGFFIKDNAKLGVDLNYGRNENSYEANVSGTKTETYGFGVNYQYYYPLIKKLYAYAGGNVSYSHSSAENGSTNAEDYKGNMYSAGVQGGITWFVSKRFALETSLLSAAATYSKTERTSGSATVAQGYKYSYTNFNLSSTGSLNNLGFKIYLLF
ncbi:MAG: autotransporter domain-containing protein [Candidatus Pedobacter colombiensis]|uniref:Autotransporter domain-containing protein n=1 Tax=Candidatus Pedobacter colombiensis TaxID=3121371 RepID=A0AAJ6B4S7_9SPHI|nr:outer membrane beta-barrel protein [Pedobacter sp.]WEK17460.1 MAG: autotransporter domain-containing protein [Pedobacter sp.]